MAVARRNQNISPSQTVSYGDWIRIPIPGTPSSAKMQIGNTVSPAFIDRQRAGAGWQTVAALRCPNLRPGEYDVKVLGPQPPVIAVIAVV